MPETSSLITEQEENYYHNHKYVEDPEKMKALRTEARRKEREKVIELEKAYAAKKEAAKQNAKNAGAANAAIAPKAPPGNINPKAVRGSEKTTSAPNGSK